MRTIKLLVKKNNSSERRPEYCEEGGIVWERGKDSFGTVEVIAWKKKKHAVESGETGKVGGWGRGGKVKLSAL